MNLKNKLCNELIENNMVKEFDVINHSYSNSRLKDFDKRGVECNNMTPTLDTRCDCLGVVVNDEPKVINPLKDKTQYGWHFEQQVYDENGITRTVKSGGGSGNIPKVVGTNNLRIRKLTPLECYRLMGFDDDDFNKAAKVNSNAQLYKQAGNSIVVNVLENIFKQMI